MIEAVSMIVKAFFTNPRQLSATASKMTLAEGLRTRFKRLLKRSMKEFAPASCIAWRESAFCMWLRLFDKQREKSTSKMPMR